MKSDESSLAAYWRQNAGPILIGLILTLGLAALLCRLLRWDYRLLWVAAFACVAQEGYKYFRFVRESGRSHNQPKE